MFFLPAKLAKEARNEVLSHWMETVQEVQFRVSVFTIIKWFSFSFLLNRATAFSLACCKIFVMVVIEVCCWFSPLLGRFLSGYSRFPLSSKTNISKFQFDQESGTVVEEPLDYKTVRIFAYSSTREQSNKRSETRLKTETETRERRLGQMVFSVWEKICKCDTLLPTILRNESQFHATVCIKCNWFTSHNVK